MLFRYHEDIVDCGRLERSANSYSVHPRSYLYFVIKDRISFTDCTALIAFFVNYNSIKR